VGVCPQLPDLVARGKNLKARQVKFNAGEQACTFLLRSSRTCCDLMHMWMLGGWWQIGYARAATPGYATPPLDMLHHPWICYTTPQTAVAAIWSSVSFRDPMQKMSLLEMLGLTVVQGVFGLAKAFPCMCRLLTCRSSSGQYNAPPKALLHLLKRGMAAKKAAH